MRGRGRGRTAEERPETSGIGGRVWASGSARRARKVGTGERRALTRGWGRSEEVWHGEVGGSRRRKSG